MASFIQDIGMLALDQVEPSLYAHPIVAHMSHQKVLAHEREHFGADHATVGGWLLEKWNFPEVLVTAIRYSDQPDQVQTETTDHHFLQCVGFSGIVADLSIEWHSFLGADFFIGQLASTQTGCWVRP